MDSVPDVDVQYNGGQERTRTHLRTHRWVTVSCPKLKVHLADRDDPRAQEEKQEEEVKVLGWKETLFLKEDFVFFNKTKLRGPSGAAAPLACDSAIQVEEQVAADGLYPRTTWLGNREKSCGHLGALTGAFGWLVCLLGGIHPDRGLILELF